MSAIPLRIGFRVLELALAVGLLVSGCGRSSPPVDAAKALSVQTKTLEPGTVEDSSEFIGALEAQQRIDLKSEVNGRIVQIFVTSGDGVRQGQPILQLRPDRVGAEVTSAQAAAEAAGFAQQAAQAQVDGAQANLARAQSDLQLAQTDFNRSQSLASRGAISRQELDGAQNRLEAARAAEKSGQDNWRAAQATLQQATASLRQAQAQVNVKQEDLGFTRVVAPVAGRVGDMALRLGDVVTAGQTLITIVQNQDLFLRLQVPSNRAAQLSLGLPVELLNPDTGESLATGALGFISPDVDAGAQSILVKARFPNEARMLRDGQLVQARIIWSTTTALLVPTVAVTRLGNQSFVFVATEQTNNQGQPLQVADQRPVQLGAIQGSNYRVLEGLQVGDRVVVTNILKLRDGLPITPQPASAVLSLGP
ncbi:MAG: efflux RND transporter periplasmic adaptor subunit [Cyanobacteriota bacterium]|nr:efflux RND transporter periplasmic adaptor subunit [Cyanobacteriota bacterium]